MINLFKRSAKETESVSDGLAKMMLVKTNGSVKSKIKTPIKQILKSKKIEIKDASPENCFWINHGPIVKNLVELMHATEEMDDSKFDYHTKRDGNDFVRWINDILGEKELAVKLARLKNRKSFVKVLKEII